MKNPRLLLTAFLTCCMTAAPQNAAAQSPMRTSSSVPPQVELMYVKGLRYLQNAQKTDGTYDGTYGREPGIIGFCLMSVLAHGDDPNAGPYATMVRRCVDYILSRQNKVSGYIGDSMYNHGFATLALAEAYGMVRDDRIGPALRKAVTLTLTAQKKNKTGGWRYSPESTDADSTVTGWPMASSILRRILPPFGASRSAEVARTSSWVISYSSASFIAFSTALSKASVPAFLMLPSSLRYCIRRMVLLVLASGSGRAPGAASTMSMWTVFEPISSTPSRVACECNVTMVHSIIV